MKTPVFVLIIFVHTSLLANMGALLLFPQDAEVVAGVYSGGSAISTEITIDSTDNTLDQNNYNFIGIKPFIGGYIGLQNSLYRLSISYDINYYSEIQLQRFLFNLDYRLGAQNDYKPVIGFGIGAAESKYEINSKTIDHSNGVLVFRTGTLYTIDTDHSLELLLEYSYMLDSLGSSYYTKDAFTSYNVEYQQVIMLRFGYNFEFQ
ncbi:MAG: hypothetical protein PF439_06745 [Helicobacteraceae bacterium]|jgi:hypothetical protein|nr:hypothetical protein [Helicobacteraceae bacterium]